LNIENIPHITDKSHDSVDKDWERGMVAPKSNHNNSDVRVEINIPQINKDNQTAESASRYEKDKLEKVFGSVLKVLERKNIDLRWNVDNRANSVVIKFIERDTSKIIRQIPPEEILKLREHMEEMLGMIYDGKI